MKLGANRFFVTHSQKVLLFVLLFVPFVYGKSGAF